MKEDLQELKRKVAQSCRILAMEGLVEGILGHVSVRVNEKEMLIRCRGDQETGVRYTSADAIRLVDYDGKGDDLIGHYEVPKELPIHGEIYKVRPEVSCVIHAHPPSALICGIADLEFKPIFGAFNIPAMRMAQQGIPVYPRSVLVTRPDLAAQIIELMGEKHICLMKGHGITVTGKTVEEATVRAINFHILAQATLEVARLGKRAAEIPPEDMEELPDLGSTFNDTWSWKHYVQKLEKEDRILGP
jgi:3,4-dihydroxyphthalate decarboxylase